MPTTTVDLEISKSLLGSLAGPPLVALCLNWALLGVMLIQVYMYYINFPRDRVIFKLLVYGVLILDCVQSFMLMADLFIYYVYDWGNFSISINFGLVWFCIPILGGIISTVVQLTFAWRMWVLSESRVLTGVVTILSIVDFGASIADGIKFKSLSGYAQQIEGNVAITFWLVSNVAVDVLIAVSMTILLLRTKGATTIRRTDAIINRLILLTLETGSLTASVAIVSLILFFAFPNGLMYTCPVIVLSKLYSNTLLVIFNNRALMRQAQDHDFLSTGIGSRSLQYGRPEDQIQSLHITNVVQYPAVRVDVHNENISRSDSFTLHDVQKQGLQAPLEP